MTPEQFEAIKKLISEKAPPELWHIILGSGVVSAVVAGLFAGFTLWRQHRFQKNLADSGEENVRHRKYKDTLLEAYVAWIGAIVTYVWHQSLNKNAARLYSENKEDPLLAEELTTKLERSMENMEETMSPIYIASARVYLIEKDKNIREKVKEIQNSIPNKSWDAGIFYAFIYSLADNGHFE